MSFVIIMFNIYCGGEMKLSNINPYIRVAMPSVLKHGIAKRIIYDYELIYLEYGNFTFFYGEKEYNCREGDVIFICPGVPHRFVIDKGEISQPHIHFDLSYSVKSESIPVSFKDFGEMSDYERSNVQKNYFIEYQQSPLICFSDMEKFKELFYDVISSHISNDELMAKGKLVQIISFLITDNFPHIFERREAYAVEIQIKDYIDAGHGMKMTLDDFATQFSYSKFYLEKRFRQRFGVSLIEYRNGVRLKVAQKLLQMLSVTAVSDELGYSSIYSFSRAYKKHFGYSPSQETND